MGEKLRRAGQFRRTSKNPFERPRLELQRSGIFPERGWGYRLVPCKGSYGAPGDHFWVRETFAVDIAEMPPIDVHGNLTCREVFIYRADGDEGSDNGARRSTCPELRAASRSISQRFAASGYKASLLMMPMPNEFFRPPIMMTGCGPIRRAKILSSTLLRKPHTKGFRVNQRQKIVVC